MILCIEELKRTTWYEADENVDKQIYRKIMNNYVLHQNPSGSTARDYIIRLEVKRVM